ncbi:MAG: glycine zipper 2TM domain-containing protein [Rhodoferax sp.]
MKSVLIPRLLTALLGALGLAGVGAAQGFTDQARVRNVEPQYEAVQIPREECRMVWEREPLPVPRGRDRNYGGAILGGVAGGVIGHQIGGGVGKDVATALGVTLGAIAGDQMQNRYDDERWARDQDWRAEPRHREVRRCTTVYDTQQRVGSYRVTYEYRGQIGVTTTRQHPGETLTVRVQVDPIER